MDEAPLIPNTPLPHSTPLGNGVQALTDRIEIDALRGEFTDAAMWRDYDRFAALFTEDGVWRIPDGGICFTGRDAIRAGIERLQHAWEFFVQNVCSGTVLVEGDTAAGRSYVSEFGRMRDGTSLSNHAVYHDRYRRTADGWRFARRVYEVIYHDGSPLTGVSRRPAPDAPEQP